MQILAAVPMPVVNARQKIAWLFVVASANHADATREAVSAATIHHGLAK
jgi:hypothetical protein